MVPHTFKQSVQGVNNLQDWLFDTMEITNNNMLHIREETAFFLGHEGSPSTSHLHDGKHTKNYGKIHHAMKMGKSTISTGPCSIISYVNVYQGVNHLPEAIHFSAPPPWLSPCDALSSTLGHARDPQAPVEGALVAKMSSVSGGFHQWGYPWLPPNGWLMENPW